MTAPPDDNAADLYGVIAVLRSERDALLVQKTALVEELAARTAELLERKTEFGEQIAQQAATIDVLKVMSASPGDPQPVFDLIVERARTCCGAELAALTLLDGDLLQLNATSGMTAARNQEFARAYPLPVSQAFAGGRAILTRDTVQVPDTQVDLGFAQRGTGAWHRSVLAVPLLHAGLPIGAIGLGRATPGTFSTAQVELLKIFAEQAVIAIGSAETFRALQTRTSDLQETLEYQTATSDVLNVISRSTFDLKPVLARVAEITARLCVADRAAIFNYEGGMVRLAANFGFPPEYQADFDAKGLVPLVNPDSPGVLARAARERRAVHVHDAAAVPRYPEAAIKLGNVRTALGVPLLRENEPIGVIILSRQRVEPFTDRQIELVSTFADQAVIAIENTRLITEQREALDQQIATAEVLQVINASPGNLAPVFDAMLEKAMRLCEAAFGYLLSYDGEEFQAVAHQGLPPRFAEYLPRMDQPGPTGAYARILGGAPLVHVTDLMDGDVYQTSPLRRALVDLGGARTSLIVAIRKEDRLLGIFTIYRREVRQFSDKQVALVESFAAQAAIAIENARLLTEQQEALEQQTATAEVLGVINASPGNLAPVFDAMLEKAHKLCGVTMGALLTYDGHVTTAQATRGYSEQLDALVRQPRPLHLSELIQGERFLHIPDMAKPEFMRGDFVPMFVEQSGARTYLAVALRKDGRLIGMISAIRTEVRPFSDKEITLLENFAAQAVIAMENARLITEQREALEQQTATADVLQVINASPGDLTPVFDAVLEKAMRLCGAAFGSLYTYDGERFHSAAQRGVPPAYAEFRAKNPPVARPGSVAARIIETRGPVQSRDVMASENYRAGSPSTRALVELGGIRAVLNVPLLKEGALLGVIAIYREEPGTFSDKQIALLESFAAQAVIAMENARLIDEQREALEQQTAMAEVLEVINNSPGNLAPVFDAMLERALRLCESAFGILAVPDGEVFKNVAVRGVTPELAVVLHEPARPRAGLALHRVVQGEDVVQIADIADDEAYRIGIPARRHMVDLGGAHTQLLVALRKDDALLGVLLIFRQEVRAFTDKQIALLRNFAAQAVIAMENARLLDEIRQRQEELRITFENMGDGVAMFDETQHLVAWNRKFQNILDVPDHIIARRQTFSEYVRYLAARGEYGRETDPEEHVRGLIEQAGQSRTYERTRPDGRVIEIRHNPVAGGGFVLIYADITERKRNEAEIRAARDAAEEASRTIEAAYRELKTAQANLIQAEKMASLGQLTAGIAHEIKNPLNFVNNFAALSVDLLSELHETAAPGFAALSSQQRAEIDDVSAMLTSNLQKITEHGKRADGIVKAMLEHSRGSPGERHTVDLNALIDEALNLAYHGARAQDQSFNITLERDFGEGIAPIEVNPQDMTRVFLNIFGNGFYATARRARSDGNTGFVPTLKVTTRNASDAMEIRVRDNGTGIPADIRDKLFQPFFTTKPTGEGTGLGLSITYDIVTKAHGGSIAVDSEVGEYSEFAIRLPRKP